jgi:iron(III) transport system ATP-binding protein
MADEIGVLHEGRIQQWAAAYELYHRPANRFVADFVGQGVFLPARAAGPDRLEIELGVLPRNGRTQTAARWKCS